MIGTTVSHYRILEKLGAGGMGEVYLAEDTKLDRKVALKFLPAALAKDAEARGRLLREARAASKLDHPSIVTVHAVEDVGDRAFIAMAYVEGRALDEYLKASGRDPARCIDLAIQMAEGLHKAHQAGIVHRDLKPSNILVDSDGRARILDFGLATLRGAEKLTQTGSTLGTAHYMSPEQAQGQQVGPESDVFSFGSLLYEMLSGHLPFVGEHPVAIAYAISHEEPAPLTQIPSDLQAIVTRCLAKDRQRRYASFADVLAELRKAKAALTPTAAAPAGRPSIAVLPFTNMSADPENEYFADGLTEELLNVLARNPELKVTARTSSFAFKGKQVDLREVGQKLGVATILEGSVRKAGNRVRITAQLINVVDGFHLWTETYDRVLDDIFAVQDDIARSVSGTLNVTLLGSPRAQRSRNPEAYRLYLQARHCMLRNTREDQDTAVRLYKQALELDPDDAQTWAGLAWIYTGQAASGAVELKGGSQNAKEAAAHALKLDPACVEAHRVMGMCKLSFELDWAGARHHLERALALEPNNPRCLSSLAYFLTCAGQADRAQALAERSIELDPLAAGAYANLGLAHHAAGRYDEAVKAYQKMLDLSPAFVAGRLRLGIAYLVQGELQKALDEIRQETAGAYREYGLALVYHALGRSTEADQAFAALKAGGESWAVQLALVCAYRGDTDAAFSWLEKAREINDPGLPDIRYQRLLSTLHDDPRWPEFLAKLGVAP